MKIISVLLSCVLVIGLVTSCISKTKEKGKTSAEVTDKGWVSLFDGQTTTGWRGYNSTAFPRAYWDIVDSSLHCFGVGKGTMTGTDLITEKKFENYELSLEWKISEGGNSGIFIFVQEVPDTTIYMSSPEIQVLDNQRHPDATAGVNGNHQSGSLYDMIPAVPQNAKPAGEWNQVGILVNNGQVVVKQNGVNVVSFDVNSAEWKQMCADSKFKDWKRFVNPARIGNIGLQDHGFEVWYRNIRIREL